VWSSVVLRADTKKASCVKKKIGRHAQDLIIALGSIDNIIGGSPCDYLMSTRIFTLILSEIFI
jgi:hypothetical protein